MSYVAWTSRTPAVAAPPRPTMVPGCGQQKKVIRADFCPSTLHTPRLLGAPAGECGPRKSKSGAEGETAEEQQGSAGAARPFLIRISVCSTPQRVGSKAVSARYLLVSQVGCSKFGSVKHPLKQPHLRRSVSGAALSKMVAAGPRGYCHANLN